MPTLLQNKLVKMFETLDADGNGAIQVSDFERLARKHCELLHIEPESEQYERTISDERHLWERLCRFCDINNDCDISQEEYIGFYQSLVERATKGEEAPAWYRQLVDYLFAVCDTDGDGAISLEEYEAYCLSRNIPAATAKSTFEKIDKNKDGRVTLDEAEELMYTFLLSEVESAEDGTETDVALDKLPLSLPFSRGGVAAEATGTPKTSEAGTSPRQGALSGVISETSAPALHGRSLTGVRLFNDYLTVRVLHSMYEMGFIEELQKEPEFNVWDLATRMEINAGSLQPVLTFLVDLGILCKDGERHWLEPSMLDALQKEMGFVHWLVGGYDPVIDQMKSLLRGQKAYGKDIHRDDDAMASSSAMIGREFTDPYVYPLLDREGVTTIADIGCGAGKRLIKICQKKPKLRGVGIDLSEDCCNLAKHNVEEAGLSDRILIVNGPAETWLKQEGTRLRAEGGPHDRPVDMVMCFAMFHDMMNSGTAHDFLADIIEGLGAGAFLLLHDQQRLPETGEGDQSWCRGFELVHHLMGQRLFPREDYDKLFEEVNLTVEQRVETDIPENVIYVLKT